MRLTGEMAACLEEAVLCWMATADVDGHPNVSPKEVFVADGDRILIAHIASPGTVRNIEQNPRVMVAAIDVFAQQGWRFAGDAEVLWPDDPRFPEAVAPLEGMTQGRFPILAVISVAVDRADRIVAPSAWLFPDQDARAVREQVLARYGVSEVARREGG